MVFLDQVSESTGGLGAYQLFFFLLPNHCIEVVVCLIKFAFVPVSPNHMGTLEEKAGILFFACYGVLAVKVVRLLRNK